MTRCAGCTHFQSHPAQIESRLRGLKSMSSGYASVRAEDGLCSRHDRYVAASSVCEDYQPTWDVTGRQIAGASNAVPASVSAADPFPGA